MKTKIRISKIAKQLILLTVMIFGVASQAQAQAGLIAPLVAVRKAFKEGHVPQDAELRLGSSWINCEAIVAYGQGQVDPLKRPFYIQIAKENDVYEVSGAGNAAYHWGIQGIRYSSMSFIPTPISHSELTQQNTEEGWTPGSSYTGYGTIRISKAGDLVIEDTLLYLKGSFAQDPKYPVTSAVYPPFAVSKYFLCEKSKQ